MEKHDNGPWFKSPAFARFIDSRLELTHVRTRRRSPQTNGVIERYHEAIKIEALWRDFPADGAEMTDVVENFRELHNAVRPREHLAGDRPQERYLTGPRSRRQTRRPPHSQRARTRGFLDADHGPRRPR